jgi:hypothetical protein
MALARLAADATQAVRGCVVGAVDLAVVDLRQRIGTGRGPARIERVTG